MKIEIYSHVVDINNSRHITEEQNELLDKTGLLDAADSVTFCTHFDEARFDWLKEKWKDKFQVKFKHFGEEYRDWNEISTLYEIQNHVASTEDESYILYIHHKGAGSGQHGWRQYMQYFNVERWKECVENLEEGYETVGAAYLNNPPYPFYAGNFFWARASYLRRCRKLKAPPEVNFQPQFEGQPHMRYDAECWHGSGNPKWYDMHPGPDRRWYSAPSEYRQEYQGVLVFDTTK